MQFYKNLETTQFKNIPHSTIIAQFITKSKQGGHGNEGDSCLQACCYETRHACVTYKYMYIPFNHSLHWVVGLQHMICLLDHLQATHNNDKSQIHFLGTCNPPPPIFPITIPRLRDPNLTEYTSQYIYCELRMLSMIVCSCQNCTRAITWDNLKTADHIYACTHDKNYWFDIMSSTLTNSEIAKTFLSNFLY